MSAPAADKGVPEMIIDCAHYQDGRRHGAGAVPLEEAAARCGLGGFVWLGLFEPGMEELAQVRDTFGLHELAVEDAQTFHMRPKVESYDADVRLVILRTARYDDEAEEVEFGEISVFLAPTFVITVWRASCAGRGSGWSSGRSCFPRAARQRCGRSWIRWWTGTRPLWPGSNVTSTRSRPPCFRAPWRRPSGFTRCDARPPTSTVPSIRCSAWLPRSSAPLPRSCSHICVTSRITCCWSTRWSPRSVTCSARCWRPTWR